MPETIRNLDAITIFGREVEDLTVTAPKGTAAKDRPRLVRAYGFSTSGTYYELAEATLFLLDGPGESALETKALGPDLDDDSGFLKSLSAWTVNPGVETVRLDVESGRLDELLADEMDEHAGTLMGKRVAGKRVAGKRILAGKRLTAGKRATGARLSGMRDREE